VEVGLVKFFNTENKKLLNKIIFLAVPSMLEMFMNTLVGIADTMMIGLSIGAVGVSAMSIANQIIFPDNSQLFVAQGAAIISKSYNEIS